MNLGRRRNIWIGDRARWPNWMTHNAYRPQNYLERLLPAPEALSDEQWFAVQNASQSPGGEYWGMAAGSYEPDRLDGFAIRVYRHAGMPREFQHVILEGACQIVPEFCGTLHIDHLTDHPVEGRAWAYFGAGRTLSTLVHAAHHHVDEAHLRQLCLWQMRYERM